MKTLKSSITSAGNNMKRFLMALLSLAFINVVVHAKSQFQERSLLKHAFEKEEVYEGYLKHRMPITLQLSGALPQAFDWNAYKWESDFPRQEVQNPFGVQTPYSEIKERAQRARNSQNAMAGLPGLPGVGSGDGSENQITVEGKKSGISEKSGRQDQELLDEEDLIELFGKGLNRIANGTQETSFEVPNSGFAPAPVLKNDANYSKE